MKEYPYWLDTVSNPQSAIGPQSAIRNPQYDVCIVGAGYTGLAAARHLASVGASVVVAERERIGWGASSRNGGQVLTGMKLDPGTLVARYGEARARELFETANQSIARLESLIAAESIDCDYARVGHLMAAWKPSHFDAFRDEQALLARVFGHRVELVSRAQQRSEIGTDRYHGLMVDEASGAINPARYVHGLAAAAAKRGARIVEGAAVTRVQRDGARWRVTTGAGDIQARDVLVATNGYTGAESPALQRRFVPIGSYIIATEPLAAGLAEASAAAARAEGVRFEDLPLLFPCHAGSPAAVRRPRRIRSSESADDEAGGGDSAEGQRAAIFPQLAAAQVEVRLGRQRGIYARSAAARRPARRLLLRRRLLRPRRGDGDVSRRADCAADGRRIDPAAAVRRSLSGDSRILADAVVPSARRRVLTGDGLAPVDLEFTRAEMQAMTDAVASRCIEHIATLGRQAICGDVDAAELCRSMREPAPEVGAAIEPLLDSLFRDWIPRSFNAPAPGYPLRIAIPGGGLFPAALADFITDSVNRYTGVWQAAPALVQLEANALDWLRDWMGFPPETRGLFTTGGSMATFNAIVCARERHLGAEIRRGVLYTSDQAHHSVLKSAKLAGVMPDRVRAIESDDRFRMRVDLLREAIAADRRAALTPFAVVSSAGTTNTGAVDPLEAVADVCASESLWHHIDGAYGAFFHLDASLHEALRGLPRADSLTLDPHKGMFLLRTAPARCSCATVRRCARPTKRRRRICPRCRTPRTSTIRASTVPSCRAASRVCACGCR